MRREIKFRAIDKKTKKVVFEGTLSDVRNAVERLNFTTWEWLEYISLKDKNGKEIYEGDILRAYRKTPRWRNRPEKIHEMMFEVYFDDATASFKIKYHKMGWDSYIGLDAPYEVIGNIYENPELLAT